MNGKCLMVLVCVVGVLCAPVWADTISLRNGVDGYTGSEDSYLQRGSAKKEYNFGASDYMIMQGEGVGSYAQGLMKFDISSIPVGQAIESATLRIHLYDDIIAGDTSRRGVRAYPMLVSVIYGTGDNDPAEVGEVDAHQRAQAVTNWGLPISKDYGPQPGVDGVGADFDDSISSAVSYYRSDIGSFLEIDITEIAAKWHLGVLANHGLLLLGDTSQTAGYFSSSDDPTVGERPELVIEYRDAICGDYSYPRADFSKNCYVDLSDVAVLGQKWLDCTEPGGLGCEQAPDTGASFNIPHGTVAVDGDLSEWTDVEWVLLDQVYDGDPCDIIEAKFAARWNDTANKLYVAAVVDDSEHIFTNDFDVWNASDRLEVYFSIDGGAYQEYQDNAQQYIIGHGDTTDWAAMGGNPPPQSVPGVFDYAVSVSGNLIKYEAEIEPFEYYGGLDPQPDPDIVADLQANDPNNIILFDVVVGSKNSSGFGNLSENMDSGKFWDTNSFQQYRLVSSLNCGDWGYLATDLNEDCTTNLQDFGAFAEDWFECTDPCAPCNYHPLGSISFRNGVDGYNGTEDSYLQRGSAKKEYNFGASDYMIMQGEGVGSYAQGLMKFDISDIPSDATILSATLRIYLYNDIISGSTSRRAVRAYPMLVSVNYGNKNNAPASVGEVDAHQRAQAVTDWGQPTPQDYGPQPGDANDVGADFDDSISSAASYYLSDIGSFLEIDVTDILDNWYAGTVTNHGFLLLGDTSQTAGYFRSSEHATVGERPELVVEFFKN